MTPLSEEEMFAGTSSLQTLSFVCVYEFITMLHYKGEIYLMGKSAKSCFDIDVWQTDYFKPEARRKKTKTGGIMYRSECKWTDQILS